MNTNGTLVDTMMDLGLFGFLPVTNLNETQNHFSLSTFELNKLKRILPQFINSKVWEMIQACFETALSIFLVILLILLKYLYARISFLKGNRGLTRVKLRYDN